MKAIFHLSMICLVGLMTACGGAGNVASTGSSSSPGSGGSGSNPSGGGGSTSPSPNPGCDSTIIWGGITSPTPASGTSLFVATGTMNRPRAAHTATLLNDGTVLVIDGGQEDIDDLLVSIPSAELFDAAQGQFSTTGSPCIAREFHTATLLKDGQVLVAGGQRFSGYPTWLPATQITELYNPAVRNFTSTGSMQVGRTRHTATLLGDGRVLMAGGSDTIDALDSTEIYDPVAGTFSLAANMTAPRAGHTATLLPSGKVLMIGGENANGVLASAELYDPMTNSFAATGAMTAPRTGHTATLLANGKVLVAGGSSSLAFGIGAFDTADIPALSTAELYDPATGVFTPTGMMTATRIGHTATPLTNGTVLLTGGYIDWVPAFPIEIGYETLNSAEIYDPASGSFSKTDPMNVTRLWHSATLLPDGSVLVAGGIGEDEALASAEIYKY